MAGGLAQGLGAAAGMGDGWWLGRLLRGSGWAPSHEPETHNNRLIDRFTISSPPPSTNIIQLIVQRPFWDPMGSGGPF